MTSGAPKQQPHFIISLGKSLAQITAEFSPIPGYGLLCAALCTILETCENVTQNRFASRQLAERCHYFIIALRESEDKCSLSNPRSAKAAAEQELSSIKDKMEKWAKMGKFKSYVNQDDIAREIVECHSSLSDCITKLQLTSQFEILEWQKEFSQRSKQDHQVLVEHLADVEAKQDISNDLLRNNNEMLRTLMTMMQTAMGENKQTAERIQHGLSHNLYQLQKTSGQLLPNFNLNSGEVKRTSDFPVRGNATMDIYEGIYLGSERVSMKAIRAMKTDDRTVHRFKREGEIWAKVWERDRGQYIVPFYGFCQIDGPFPYMISPWQEHGNALNYIKANDSKIDYPQFLKRVALGVHLLHTFNPPIVHGDIKSVNILIDDEGNPRLTDFGLSQIIDDVSAAPFTQSSIVADSFRYFAPEVCTGTGAMSAMADMYALGMTVLEILTHQQPYRRVRLHTEAVVRAASGKKPERPTEDRVKERGLNDELWGSMMACWSLVPEERPTIQQFIEILDSMDDPRLYQLGIGAYQLLMYSRHPQSSPQPHLYHTIMSENESPTSTIESPDATSGLEAFFNNILTPGSSLQTTFLAIVDGTFASLFVILALLAFLTSGNIHIFALMLIELSLWASVKWFVSELKKLPASNANEAEVEEKKDQ